MDADEAACLESVGGVHIEIGIAVETSATVGDEEFQMWIQRRQDLQVAHRNPLLRGTLFATCIMTSIRSLVTGHVPQCRLLSLPRTTGTNTSLDSMIWNRRHHPMRHRRGSTQLLHRQLPDVHQRDRRRQPSS